MLLLGLFFHSSFNQQIFIYSYKYFILICITSVILLGVIPVLFHRSVNKYGQKNVNYSLVPSFLVLLLAYIFFHYKYYAVQEHHFDPYIQIGLNDKIEDKEDGVIVILALGGSTTMNQNVDEEFRYPTVLQKKLDSTYQNKKIKVINAGMFWYTSKHSLINYHTYYKRIKPDIVIVMHAINDIYRSFTPPDFTIDTFKSDYSHFYGASINGANPPTFESPLFNLIGKYWFSIFRKSRAKNMIIEDFKSLDSFNYYMSTLVEDVVQDSAVCYIVEQPSFYKEQMSHYERSLLLFGETLCSDGNVHPNIRSLDIAMTAFNNSAAGIANKMGATFIKSSGLIKKDAEHFVDDVHYTNLGSQKLGELVYEQLVRDSVLF